MKLEELFEDIPNKSTVEYDKLITLLKQKYKNNLLYLASNPDKVLWRGGEHQKSIQTGKSISYIIQQSPTDRKSLTGKSYINLIQANSSLWTKFPKRNASTFCTTSYDNAYEFGNPLLLLLPDFTKNIATCPKDWNDIEVGTNGRVYEISDANMKISLTAFQCQTIIETVGQLNLSVPVLERLMDEKIINKVANNTSDYQDLIKFINMMDNIINYADEQPDNVDDKTFSVRLQKFAEYIVEKFGQVPSKWFKNILIPEKMGCYVYPSYKSADFYETDDNEIWFSGEYMLLDLPKNFHKTSVFQDLVNLVKA